MIKNLSKELGDLGEKIAQDYLKKKDYKILDKNYSPKFISGPQRGEIDIVAKRRRDIADVLRGKKENAIHFIEVKTLISKSAKNPQSWISRPNGFLPEEKVNFQKQRKILKAAESWMMEKKMPLDTPRQIDVIAIRVNLKTKKAKLRHFQNIL